MIDSEDEYGIVLKSKDYWQVHKFDGHHKKLVQTYNVKIYHGNIYCDCPASTHECKHIKMVNTFRLGYFNEKMKKDLF